METFFHWRMKYKWTKKVRSIYEELALNSSNCGTDVMEELELQLYRDEELDELKDG